MNNITLNVLMKIGHTFTNIFDFRNIIRKITINLKKKLSLYPVYNEKLYKKIETKIIENLNVVICKRLPWVPRTANSSTQRRPTRPFLS